MVDRVAPPGSASGLNLVCLIYVAFESIDERLKRFHLRVLFEVIYGSLEEMSCVYKVARNSSFSSVFDCLSGVIQTKSAQDFLEMKV